jgi:D-lactate dehydrogenase (cytochrome)
MKEKSTGIENYLQDESNSKSSNIEKVCIPENSGDLSEFLRNNDSPFVIYGGGTGIVGGATADRGVIISTEKFKMISLDKEHKVITLGAGVRLGELHNELDKHGLWYPVDSTEQTATIGGNAATNAWGTRSYKYGSIRNFIEALGIVAPDGRRLDICRGEIAADGLVFNLENGRFEICDLPEKYTVKNSAGYYMKKGMDIIDLFIGSEGTLGIITDLKLKVMEEPIDIHAFMIPFDGQESAFKFIKCLKTGVIQPLSIEFMDNNSIDIIKDKYPVLEGTGCLVTVEIEENDNDGPAFGRFVSFLDKYGLDQNRVKVSSSRDKAGIVHEIRQALPQAVNESIRHKNVGKVSTDYSVNDARLDDMLEAYDRARVNAGVKSVLFGHAGNNNLHINFLPGDEQEYIKAVNASRSLAEIIAGMGGTVSSEHGLGKLKKGLLKYMYTDIQIGIMKDIKRFFDPENLCSPGNIFD